MRLKEIIKNFYEGINSIQIWPQIISLENINPNYSNKYSLNAQNLKALGDDWKQVEEDMNMALKKFEGQYN
ncbi:hypothetical protein KAR52_00250 [Candidatus Pacearchaeota archaeon]|nr:hypothetical protein [Candidatus Pacearchaeota archaeon]